MPTINSALTSLPKEMGACTTLVGEAKNVDSLEKKKTKVDTFQMSTLFRELATEFYRQVGNVCADFTEDDFTISRSFYYNKFLKSHVSLLQEFLDNGCPLNQTPFLKANRVLKLINPDRVLAGANKRIHDISYDDVFVVLATLREENPEDADEWEALVNLLTDKTNLQEWEGNLGEVKGDFIAKRKRMASHQIRQHSAEFEEKQVESREKELYSKLKKKGYMVSSESFRHANTTLALALGGLIVVVTILAVKLNRLTERLDQL